MISRLLVSLSLVLTVVACQSAYYRTLESLGIEKRDVLVDRVEDARDSQVEAKEQFASALEEFSALMNFDGGELEARYKSLNSAFERSEAQADEVRQRIEAVEDVAEDLFDEWEDELQQYSDASLRRQSARQLADTRARYQQLIRAMRKVETRIEPVLAAFRDQVLFLKHNLNAKAVASLQGELSGIETDVARLIREMEASIREAEKFVERMSG